MRELLKLGKGKPLGDPLTQGQKLSGARPGRRHKGRSQDLSAANGLGKSISARGDHSQPHQIEYAGMRFTVPDTEQEVWDWVDGINDDTRVDDETRMYAGILAGLLVRAIRTGEGVVS